MSKISLIIPAYNTGRLLKRLMGQIAEQAKEYDLEAIVIDDGSDEDISWVQDYPFVIFRRQENQGPGAARNVGLDLATGDIICFVDSDDQILPNFCFVVLDNHVDGDLDWVAYDWESDGDPTRKAHRDELAWNYGIALYSFKASVIGDNRFRTDMNVEEDQEFLRRVLKPEHKHARDPRIIYNYTWNGNENSLSHRFLRGELTVWKDKG